MKKILFIHDMEKVKEDKNGNLYTDGSYTMEIWERYLYEDNQLTIITRKEDIKYECDIAKQRFHFLDTNVINHLYINDLYSNISCFFSIKNRKQNKQLLKEEIKKADKVIMRVPSFCQLYIIKLCKKMKKPILIELVACPFDSLWNKSILGKLLAIPYYLSTKYITRKADYILYVTNKFLQSRYPTKRRQINCSDVELKKFENIDTIIKRRKTQLKQNHIIIGTIGNIDVKYKGYKYVLKAISKIKNKNITIQYEIVGAGNGNYLKKQIYKMGLENQIKLLGSLSHDEIFKWLDSIDIYIQPSLLEGLPRSVIEAMSRGCPVLGSNVGGIPELISKDCLFKKKNSIEIMSLLTKYINNFDLLLYQSKKNYEYSKIYEKEFLDNKRNKFYNEFINQYSKNSNL